MLKNKFRLLAVYFITYVKYWYVKHCSLNEMDVVNLNIDTQKIYKNELFFRTILRIFLKISTFHFAEINLNYFIYIYNQL